MPDTNRLPDIAPLAVTMGDPAGIGGDITLAAWLTREATGVPPFVLIDDADRIAGLAERLGWAVPVARIEQPAQAVALFPKALPVLHRPLPVPVQPGKPTSATADAVCAAIAEAVALVRTGAASAVVTNPINKDVLQHAGFRFPGHTEYLADLAGTGDVPVMMLACPALRVVPVTIHIPLEAVAQTLTTAAIVHAGRVTAQALARDFGIARPRLAVAGLNPHAGERGRMGDQETRIIAPAVEALRDEGLTVSGPLPADTLFHPAARARHDAVLCMYHDQALIPIKTVDFAGGVNVTLGLPFVRTSPDHGTAFDIAGQGTAQPDSLVAALHMAATMVAHRQRTAAEGPGR
ncbi:4-hydroxythreonine-4-phosphate dehydrogenase PdxA [Roseospira marina]|uniref:4-hydroxythreonine-4-phosphate dehydrogenase n=1 Tax=Roseospira marina TaxID=140057 RepID=A0A5M6IGB5_9PROT|nr:4-hydroxythreonine-4-phosphate dehydrogenase PdxA [Roseospira marina]KAA5607350.1 4-hydroxythreonine-4-phosphate dehydrogenase PdxA [Roseospira marina]MBB4312484.1 4-hydroxythreonine-4-phosphate dehydrogenase [Roseospira marina]MBB5085500.1 4-hydroxythreonine-4-phosphate dehydrogenase [Roseospira marina]